MKVCVTRMKGGGEIERPRVRAAAICHRDTTELTVPSGRNGKKRRRAEARKWSHFGGDFFSPLRSPPQVNISRYIYLSHSVSVAESPNGRVLRSQS